MVYFFCLYVYAKKVAAFAFFFLLCGHLLAGKSSVDALKRFWSRMQQQQEAVMVVTSMVTQ